MKTENDQKDKQELLLELLGTGYNVMIHVETKSPNKGERLGVVIPSHLYDKGPVGFEIGYNMLKPIPDLEVTDDGVSCSLSFGGSNYGCFFPWDKILAFSGEAFAKMAEADKIRMRAALDASKPKSKPEAIEFESRPELKDTKVPWLKIVK
jgi:hypothetical protein